MNDRQRRFVEEYCIDLNITQAAIRAEYDRCLGMPDQLGLRSPSAFRPEAYGENLCQRCTGWKEKRLTVVHETVYGPAMGIHKTSRAHTIRMRADVWEAIERMAASIGATRNEVAARCLTRAFCGAPELRKTDQFIQIPADHPVLTEIGDD